MEMSNIAVNCGQLCRRAPQASEDGSIRGEWERGNAIAPSPRNREEKSKLSCDVDRTLIMAAAAVFCQRELYLDAEGSLLLSRASPLLCILLQSATLK